MSRSILVLPIGGGATRMQGLPKFLLPYNQSELLIDKHISGARDSGYEFIIVIVKAKFFSLLSEYLIKYGEYVKLVQLESDTQTMAESLIVGLSGFHFNDADRLVIGLADTALKMDSYEEFYLDIKESTAPITLTLFPTQAAQMGKLGQVLIDEGNSVLDIRDKDEFCSYPQFWGIASFLASFLAKIDPKDAHIGISVFRWLKEGNSVTGILTKTLYFDCGTFVEYKRFIENT